MNSFKNIRGIGPQTAKTLVEHGFADVGAVAGAAVADLAAVPGFSVARAEKTIEAAKALMGSEDQPVSRTKAVGVAAAEEATPAMKQTGKKDKDDKKAEKTKGKKDKKEKKKKKKKKK